MNWYKRNSINDLINKIKNILITHPFTKSIADYYHIPIEDVKNNLEIEVANLGDRFSEGNGRIIRLDKKILDKDFFKTNFHFVVHEFFHWVKRRSEELFYFNDSEEIQSFVIQMTWLLILGKSEKEVTDEIFPIIKTHYKTEAKSKQIFDEMMEKSVGLYHIYEKEGGISI